MRKTKKVRALAVAFMVGALSLSTLMSNASNFLATAEEPTASTTEAPETKPEETEPVETAEETTVAEETAGPEETDPAEETTAGQEETEPVEETDPAEEPTLPEPEVEVIENEDGKVTVSTADNDVWTAVTVEQEEGILIPSLVEEVIAGLDDDLTVITVNLENRNQEVPASLLNAAKGKNVELTFYVAEGAYSLAINGKDITDENAANGINLSVTSYDAAEVDTVAAVIPANASGVVYDFAHSGILPTTTVTVPTTGLFRDNTHLYCYYVNEAENKMELVDDMFVIGGLASFTIDHCSKYVLLDTKLDGAAVEEPSDGTTAAETTIAETNAEDTTTADKTVESTEGETDPAAPSTGDTMNPFFYVGLAVFAVIFAVAAVKLFGRRPEERNE